MIGLEGLGMTLFDSLWVSGLDSNWAGPRPTCTMLPDADHSQTFIQWSCYQHAVRHTSLFRYKTPHFFQPRVISLSLSVVAYGLSINSSSLDNVLPFPDYSPMGPPPSMDSPQANQFTNMNAPPLDLYSNSVQQVGHMSYPRCVSEEILSEK